MKKRLIIIGILVLAVVAVIHMKKSPDQGEIINLSSQWQNTAEVDRLRWFKEINAIDILKHEGLSGKGVMVTIMGEIVDAAHPDLKDRVKKQYNTYLEKGKILAGAGNQSIDVDELEAGDSHGTHIAGTIAAACDGVGIQGLACDADIQVYDLGAYDSSAHRAVTGWGDANEFERFIVAFSNAMNDIAKKKSSKIVTGSFNLESPAIDYSSDSGISGKSITEIINQIGSKDFKDIIEDEDVVFENPDDQTYLEKIIADNENDESIALQSFLPLSKKWDEMTDAIAAYQKTDGVYLVTESNYIFDGRSSTLNALPHLSDKIDKDLWLSVVMVQPKNLEISSEGALQKLYDKKEYILPINSCGELASEYCILTPSWNVLSTMTKRVTSAEEGELYDVNERFYKSFDGHSMGAPMVAAALALMEEKNQKEGSHYTMKELVIMLKENANRSFPGYDSVLHGRGLLDIGAAIKAMSQTKIEGRE